MTKILIVDDEVIIQEVLEAYFEKEGYQTYLASNGLDALKKIKAQKLDLIILDLMLPDIDGEEICRLIRVSNNHVPIIMLTSKGTESDMITGIELGADDYIKKPFSPREVVVRSKALLRRSNYRNKKQRLLFNDQRLIIDMEKKEVLINNSVISLTPIEYKILTAMATYPGKVYDRSALIDKIQSDIAYYDGYERSIDTHIKNLRKKIENDTRHPEYIVTVFGMGYKFGGQADDS